MKENFEIEKEYVRCNLCDADNTQLLFVGKDRLFKKAGLFNVVKCKECGLIYLNPRPTQKSISYYYPPDYDPYKKIGFDNVGIMGKGKGRYARIKNWIKKTILEGYYSYSFDDNFKSEKKSKSLFKEILVSPFLSKYREMYYGTIPFFDRGKVLDIGCGSGSYLAWLKELGWEPYGVEIDEDCVKFAREEYGIDTFCGDLSEANFPDGFFDCITMWHFLEHSPHPLETLRESNRILKRDGLVVICVPNIDSLEAKLLREWSILFDVPRHLYDFSSHTLKRLLNKAGFRIKKNIYYKSLAQFERSLNKFLGGKGYKMRMSSKWRLTPLIKFVGELLSLFRLSSVMTFYAEKQP